MDAVILQKFILTSLLLNFVFALGASICNDRKYYVLKDLCMYSLGLNSIFILVALLLRVWM